jgi:hypothetical protein
MRKLTAALGAAIAIISGAILAAGPASAATTVTASTHLTNRADSGGNGDWATDAMTRKLTITHVSGTSYTATVTDSGTFTTIPGAFTTIPGAFTPNQGGADAGLRIAEILMNSFTGQASYSFTASASPQASLVPASESGTPASGPKTTSLWYEQAFPAGTVFGGTGITTWGWNYAATAVTFLPGGGFTTCTQKWADTSANDGGQDAGAGNITGACPAGGFSFRIR